MNCPRCSVQMCIINVKKLINYHMHDILLEYEAYECPACELIASTIEQTADLQKQMIEKMGEV